MNYSELETTLSCNLFLVPTSLPEKGDCSTVLIEEAAQEWKHNCEGLSLEQQTDQT